MSAAPQPRRGRSRSLLLLAAERSADWRTPGQDTFLVSDPSLIREAVRRTDYFSSNLVSVLHDIGTGCPEAYTMAPFGDPVHVLATADPKPEQDGGPPK